MTGGVPTAALVVIGNEILSGKVADQNAAFVISELRKLGVRLSRIVVIEDEIEDIAAEVRMASDRYDWVFTSGGLGPTHDDVTVAGVARAFGVEPVESPRLRRALTNIRHGRPMESLLRLAMVPDGAELFWGDDGQALWPTIYMKNVYIFPGVPAFLRSKLGAMRERLRAAPFCTGAVYCSRAETELVSMIEAAVTAHPEVEVGSYPQFGDVDHKVRVTFDAKTPAAVESAMRTFLAALPPEAFVRSDPPTT